MLVNATLSLKTKCHLQARTCSGLTKQTETREVDAFCTEGCLCSRDNLGALVSHATHIRRHKHRHTCLRLLAAGNAVRIKFC